jgi:hypothetical protein
MVEFMLSTRGTQASTTTRVEEEPAKLHPKICEPESLDMGEASRWQGFMLNGCR